LNENEKSLVALADRVLEMEGRQWFDLSPADLRDIQRADEAINGVSPANLPPETLIRLREIARTSRFYSPERPRIETPFKARLAETKREVEAAEATWATCNEVWRQRARQLEAKAALRFRKASGNPTRMAAAQSWADAGRAEVAALEAAWRVCDTASRMARARLNALQLSADRWRHDQEVRVSAGGETLTLQQFDAWKKNN
jgi:hypothetical protein